jgi:EVE domain
LADDPQHWLLVRGTGERPPAQRIEPETLRRHSSTRRPSVQKGDLAICYASGWQVIFAVVHVVGDPENDPERTRWRWRFPIRPLVSLRDLREAPPVEVAGVFPRSLGRHSYVRLTPEQFRAARAAIEEAVAAS